MRTSIPFSLAFLGQAHGGDLGVGEDAAGIATQSLAALCPAMTSATTSPSFVALCASIGTLEQSPIA